MPGLNTYLMSPQVKEHSEVSLSQRFCKPLYQQRGVVITVKQTKAGVNPVKGYINGNGLPILHQSIKTPVLNEQLENLIIDFLHVGAV